MKLRYWACVCLLHTVENKDDLRWEGYSHDEAAQIAKWKNWWNKDGKAFMKGAAVATKPAK